MKFTSASSADAEMARGRNKTGSERRNCIAIALTLKLFLMTDSCFEFENNCKSHNITLMKAESSL